MQNTAPISTDTTANSSNENVPVLDIPKQTPSSSKSMEACNENNAYKKTDLSISDKVPAASSQPEVQNNVNYSNSKTVQPTTQLQNAGAKVYTSENKINSNNSVQTDPKGQPTLPKTYSPPPMNSQKTPCIDTKEASINEPTKNIDLSSLSAALNDGKIEEEPSTVVSNDVINETSISSSDQKLQDTSSLY